MKFQIGIGVQKPRKQYTLLDFKPLPGYPEFTGKIDELPCEDGECVEILASNMLDYINADILPAVINSWLKKVRKSGTIALGGTDLPELVRLTNYGQITAPDFNAILNGKNYIHSSTDFVKFLKSQGCAIKKQTYTGLHFLVEFGKK